MTANIVAVIWWITMVASGVAFCLLGGTLVLQSGRRVANILRASGLKAVPLREKTRAYGGGFLTGIGLVLILGAVVWVSFVAW